MDIANDGTIAVDPATGVATLTLNNTQISGGTLSVGANDTAETAPVGDNGGSEINGMTIKNAGTIEAKRAILGIYDSAINNPSDSFGSIEAIGAGSVVDIAGTTIVGGTLEPGR